MKFIVSPPQAYLQASGDLSAGGLHPLCRSCGENLTWYSDAGMRETYISGMCEPCFDFVTWPRDEPAPAWMELVKYNTKESQ